MLIGDGCQIERIDLHGNGLDLVPCAMVAVDEGDVGGEVLVVVDDVGEVGHDFATV